MNPEQVKDKKRVAKAWRKKLASYDNRRIAAGDGYSLQAVADALGVTRQRIYNQISGPAPISPPLRAHLEPLLRLEPAPLALLAQLPAQSPEERQDGMRENQRKIQTKINENKIERIPAILLEEKPLIRKWKKLVTLHGGKSAAVRALIAQA